MKGRPEPILERGVSAEADFWARGNDEKRRELLKTTREKILDWQIEEFNASQENGFKIFDVSFSFEGNNFQMRLGVPFTEQIKEGDLITSDLKSVQVEHLTIESLSVNGVSCDLDRLEIVPGLEKRKLEIALQSKIRQSIETGII